MTITCEHASECVTIHSPIDLDVNASPGTNASTTPGSASASPILQLPDLDGHVAQGPQRQRLGQPRSRSEPDRRSDARAHPSPTTHGSGCHDPNSKARACSRFRTASTRRSTTGSIATDFSAFRQITPPGLPLKKTPEGDPNTKSATVRRRASRSAREREPQHEVRGDPRIGTRSGTSTPSKKMSSTSLRSHEPRRTTCWRMVNVSGDALKAAETGLDGQSETTGRATWARTSKKSCDLAMSIDRGDRGGEPMSRPRQCGLTSSHAPKASSWTLSIRCGRSACPIEVLWQRCGAITPAGSRVENDGPG